MNWPQITLIILFAFGLGVTAIRHGEPRNDKYSFWWQLAGNLGIVWLLWCGGFFSQARAAQPPQAALQYRDDVIRNARLEWGLSAPVADFAAQLHQESGWRPDAVSPAGAQGLAQFMPATADWISQLMPDLTAVSRLIRHGPSGRWSAMTAGCGSASAPPTTASVWP